MCSICGSIKKDIEQSIILKMNSALAHRGPDDNGIYFTSMFSSKNSNVGIGHNRLSIRDLSSAGHQPMTSSDGSIVIAFNGEIYNADNYRKELEDSGFVFRGNSDTEVLLDLYEKYGIDVMLDKIDGMFAICIIDKGEDCIFLIRDRLGEKPLYTYQTEDVFMWASEYKAFYEHPDFHAELEKDNLTEYLMFRYVADGGTLLRGVNNLQPGSYLIIDKNGIKKKIYWEYPDTSLEQQNELPSISGFIDRLHIAFETRTVSDVEIGVQLSGGVDSSCLTEFVSKLQNKESNKLKTFGIIFDGKRYSEEKYMEKVVNHCEVEPVMYNFTNDLFLDSWKETTYYFESPMNHEGTLGLFYLNRRASEKVKVMLCGEGADESMGGYYRFYDSLMLRTNSLYRLIKQVKSIYHRNGIDRAVLSHDWDLSFIKDTQYVNDYDVKKLYKNCDMKRVLSKRFRLLKQMPGVNLKKLMHYELSTYCQDLLMRADKVSMASSMEQRVPYLMPELIEYEDTLYDNYFVTTGKGKPVKCTKKILKDYCSSIFGDSFTYREKQGFGIPLADYFTMGVVKKYIQENILPSIKKRRILNYNYINKMFNELLYKEVKPKHNNSNIQSLWVAFSFEIWAQMFLDGNPNSLHRK